jgi:hypothetical protein
MAQSGGFAVLDLEMDGDDLSGLGSSLGAPWWPRWSAAGAARFML